jgi:hypothetical protein
MTPFQYAGFYDYPRTIVLRHREKLLLLESRFDDELDEYPKVYTVYLLPQSAKAQLNSGSWKFLEGMQLDPIGRIPIESVRFDRTRRKKLDASILDKLPF